MSKTGLVRLFNVLTFALAIGFVIISFVMPINQEGQLFIQRCTGRYDVQEPLKNFAEIFKNLNSNHIFNISLLFAPVATGLLATVFAKGRLWNIINIVAISAVIVLVFSMTGFENVNVAFNFLRFLPVGSLALAILAGLNMGK